jgi:hypothetical protein
MALDIVLQLQELYTVCRYKDNMLWIIWPFMFEYFMIYEHINKFNLKGQSHKKVSEKMVWMEN